MLRELRLHVDFPALDRLVTYLTDRDVQQRQIDATAAKLDALRARLRTANSKLADASKGLGENNG